MNARPTSQETSPTSHAVRVEHVTKRFGEHTALNNLTFDVPYGQFVAVIGLSGAGKSTLLRLLNGLQTPTEGTMEILGVNVVAAGGRSLRALRCNIGFVFQQFNLVGRLSVLENVLSGSLGRLHGPRIGVGMYAKALRREALDQLDRVGLGSRAFQRADTLSGGEQQRVAIARSLMQRPRLLLADEPVASLDPESSGQVMDLLCSICCEEQQLTVICSLHQVDMALGWAHRVIGLREGQLVLDQPAHQLARASVMRVYQRELEDQETPAQLAARPSRQPGIISGRDLPGNGSAVGTTRPITNQPHH